MPAICAHYQFGQIVFEQLDKDIKQLILPYKDTFDIGLQGPDILFYYKPYKTNDISSFGHGCHRIPGFRFFEYGLKNIDNPVVLAYMLGVCCHYTLDSHTHPYINSRSTNSFEHQYYESAIEHAIIIKYGLSKKRHQYVYPKRVHFDAISKFFDKVSKTQCRSSGYMMYRLNRVFNHRRLVVFIDCLLRRKGTIYSLCLDENNPDNNDTNVFFKLFDESVILAVENINEIYRKGSIASLQYDFEGNYHEI